jgi:hypothetical protein
MRESLRKNQPETSEGITRRGLLKSGAAIAGVAALTATGGMFGPKFRKNERAERAALEHKNHALDRYMQESELADNWTRFLKIRKDLVAAVKSGADNKYHKKSDEERARLVQEDSNPIVAERDRILTELDKRLVPELLVTYTRGGLTPSQKSLIRVYASAGGDLDAIRTKGVSGLNQKIVSQIYSVLKYYGGDTAPHMEKFGVATQTSLEFDIGKKKPMTSTDSTENLA